MASALPAQDASIGMLGRYRLLRRLAVGGMAEVFLATSSGAMGFQKTVVVKRIHGHLADDKRFVNMFLAEASLVARLNHHNIVQTFDFGFEDGHHFIAMEHVDGTNLYDFVAAAARQGMRLPYEVCAKIISGVCEGLECAHNLTTPAGESLGLVHRDISPDNILIGRSGAVKVSDFGIARLKGETQIGTGGRVFGKVSFISPEHVRSLELDRRADVFMVGVVLYWLLTGIKPFIGSDDMAVLSAILNQEPIPMRDIRPDMPEALEKIVRSTLQKDRALRPASCREVYEALESYVMSSGKPVGTIQLGQLCQKLLGTKDLAPARPATPPATMTTPPGAAKAPQVPKDTLSAPITVLPVQAEDPPTTLHLPNDAPPIPQLTRIDHSELPPKWRNTAVAAGVLLFVFAGLMVVRGSRQQPTAPQLPNTVNVRPPENPSSGKNGTSTSSGNVDGPKPSAITTNLKSGNATELFPKEPVPAEPVAASGRCKGPSCVKPVPVKTQKTQPSAPKGVARAEPAPRASGEIRVNIRAQVRVNGTLLGWAPVTIPERAPGEVEVELFNNDLHASKTVPLELEAGRNPTFAIRLGKGTLDIRVQPYATVYVDGERVGDTPLAPLSVYEGTHVVKLVNPDADKPYTVQVVVTENGTTPVRHRF
ncbi:MAG: protein kinase domain-containing protein [Myxococcaceae bacterium]